MEVKNKVCLLFLCNYFQCYIQRLVDICQQPTSIMDLIIKFANEDDKWWVKSLNVDYDFVNVYGVCEWKDVQYTLLVTCQ